MYRPIEEVRAGKAVAGSLALHSGKEGTISTGFTCIKASLHGCIWRGELMVCWQCKTLDFEQGSSVQQTRRLLECLLQGSSNGHHSISHCVCHWFSVLPHLL